MLLSIIIPAYQAEATIEKCISSALDSVSSDYEIIVIDDGSYDSTACICSRMANVDPRIKLIQQSNFGRSAARNRGIAESNGTWMMFLDADDWILPGSIDRVLESIGSLSDEFNIALFKSDDKCKSVSGVFNIGIVCSNGFDVACRMLDPMFDESDSSTMNGYNLETVWAKAYRKHMLINQKHLFDTQLHLGEDALFNLPVFADSKIALCGSVIYHYEISNPGTCRLFNFDDSQCLLTLYKEISSAATACNLPHPCVEAYIASSFSSFCKRVAIYGDVSAPAVIDSVDALAKTELVSNSIKNLRASSFKNRIHNWIFVFLAHNGFTATMLKFEHLIYNNRRADE